MGKGSEALTQKGSRQKKKDMLRLILRRGWKSREGSTSVKRKKVKGQTILRVQLNNPSAYMATIKW